MKTPTTLPIKNLSDFYADTRNKPCVFDDQCFLFLASGSANYAVVHDAKTEQFVALEQRTFGSADVETVWEIARSEPHGNIDPCNAACMRGLYFDCNNHLDAETHVAPKFIAD
jgi:hypothetical protein